MFKKVSLPLALLAGCVVLAAPTLLSRPMLVWADDDDNHDDDDVVHDLMEKTHEGKKSPWRKATQAIGADPIVWAEVDLALPRLEKMAAALANSKDAEVRGSADGYVDAVKELAANSKKRDATKTREAVKTLSQSCGDCHFKGGPGGKLD